MSVHDSPARNLAAFGYGCLAFLAVVTAMMGTVFTILFHTVEFTESEERMSNSAEIGIVAMMVTLFVSISVGIVVGNRFGKMMMRKMRSRALVTPGAIAGSVAALGAAGVIGLIMLILIAAYLFIYVMLGYMVFFIIVGAASK